MKEKGFTGLQLKLIGLIFMVFDHFHYFFSESYKIPIAFRWVGRIVAPLFMFMVIEGYTHTRNKKKYIFRLWFGSIIMSIGNFLVPRYFARADNFILMNNIFGTLLMIGIYLCIVDFMSNAIKEKNLLKTFLGIILFIAPIALGIIMLMGMGLSRIFIYLAFIIPTPIFVEGGPFFIILGVMMYLLRENRKKLIIGYMIMSFTLMFAGEINISELFMRNYQWMMVFAAPLLYLYNGQKGRGMKYLFYVFYPAHIYIFYIISSLIMNK